jgi:hypothetical protein
MKKNYIQPTLWVVKIQQTNIICASTVTSVSTNLTGGDAFNYGGGGSGTARGRNFDDWGDDWDDE